MENVNLKHKKAPRISGDSGFNALAQKVFEKGMRRITKLEGLQHQYVELLGTGSDEIQEKLDAEAERLDRVLTKMLEIKESKKRWEDLLPSQIRLLAMCKSSTHDEDELYRANEDPEVRLKIMTRDMDEEEYTTLLYQDLFTPAEKKESKAEVADWKAGAIVPFEEIAHEAAEKQLPIAAEKKEEDVKPDVIVPTKEEMESQKAGLTVAVVRDSLSTRAAHISASAGEEVAKVRQLLEDYSDSEIQELCDVATELSLDPAKLVAIDIMLREDYIPKEAVVLGTIGPTSEMKVMASNTRLQKAINIAVCGSRVETTMVSVFVNEYSKAFVKRMEKYAERLARLRAQIVAEEGPGREVEAQRKFEEESKKIRQPIHRADELKPKLSVRHLVKISQLLCHDDEGLERFVDYFEREFDLGPTGDDRGSRWSKTKQIANYHGISTERASELLKQADKNRKLDGFNPTAQRHYRVLTGILRMFIEEHYELINIDEEAGIFHMVRDAVEKGKTDAVEPLDFSYE